MASPLLVEYGIYISLFQMFSLSKSHNTVETLKIQVGLRAVRYDECHTVDFMPSF